MYQRDIYPNLAQHLMKKQVTVITGMRRVGKSTAVKYLLAQVSHKNVLYLDCERIEIRVLFSHPNYEEIKIELEIMGFDFTKPGLIAIDEIQLSENLPSIIKYFYDTYEVKFVVTGSSSYYMKHRFSESLAGRKRIFEMYPLSFKEFLVFKRVWKNSFQKFAMKSFERPWFNRMKDLYQEFISFGGFPEVVLEEKEEDKKELLLDIVNSYIELDVKLLEDYSVSEDLYKLIKLLAARTGNKVDYSKLSSVLGMNRQKIASYIQLLESTYLIYQITPFTKNIDREIANQKKLYFADTGILNTLAGNAVSSGQVFENIVAVQLLGLREIQFYQRRNGQEIDFILDGSTAIEVKETPVLQDKNTLIQRASTIDIQQYWVAGRYPPSSNFEDFIWGGAIF
ncbi:ATP-binding protein [Olivibacter ginsenosidimutans]|uniref:ATP-binding protein n=1 Tax=Olivibacter ginsenosidimutans TaxID=1176537 RepID=A0ABP9C1E1_9SPHI